MIKKVLFFLFLAFVVSLFFLPGRLIKIGKLECESQYGSCPDQLINIDSELSLISAKKKVKKELENNFLVGEYSFQYKIPSTLKVNVVVRKAIYAVNQKGTQNYILVDSEGYIVGISDQSSLPTIIIDDKLQNVGEKVDEVEIFALKLISGVYNMYQIGIGNVKDDTLTVELAGGLNVIFPLGVNDEFNADYYLGALRLIMTKIEAESPGIYRELDLRFKNPVLR